NTERTEHALRVVDGEGLDAEALACRTLGLFDVDAIDRAGHGTSITGDAGRQIELVESAMAGPHWHGDFRIFVNLGECGSSISLHPQPECDGHPFTDGRDRNPDVS